MLNKILILFIIILNNFIFSNSFSNDQLNFDVTEIEILDGGNKIKGKKRGTITTNNGIIISADEFEYNKINNILSANGNIKIEDKLNNYNILSENVTYFKNNEKIEINGKSNSLIYSKYNFKTEDIIILRDQLIIKSDKAATIIDEKNQTLYEISKFSYSLKDEIL